MWVTAVIHDTIRNINIILVCVYIHFSVACINSWIHTQLIFIIFVYMRSPVEAVQRKKALLELQRCQLVSDSPTLPSAWHQFAGLFHASKRVTARLLWCLLRLLLINQYTHKIPHKVIHLTHISHLFETLTISWCNKYWQFFKLLTRVVNVWLITLIMCVLVAAPVFFRLIYLLAHIKPWLIPQKNILVTPVLDA